jgi:hypothetical protein
MPYPRAHYWLLLLFPLTALAFWPAYFSNMRGAPYAFHVHGISASLWIALLAFQSWAIHGRRNALHRSVGLASFALFPFFVAGGFLVLQTMAVKFAAQSDPFYRMFGARLGTVDLISSLAIPWLFMMALRTRRTVHLHARYMLATVFFLLAPILSRLAPALPPFAIGGPDDLYKFVPIVHLANGGAVLLALFLAWRIPKHGRPWLAIAGLIAFQSLAFETVGRSAAWESLYSRFGTLPAPLVASIGFALAIAATWAGWSAVPPAPARRAAVA